MRFLKRAASLFRNRPNESAGESVVNDTVSLTIGGVKGLALLPIIIPVFALILAFLTLLVSFNGKIQLMQMVDPYNQSSVGVDLNYDYEEIFNLSNSTGSGSANAESLLKNTPYGGVAGFNQHIKDQVNAAGWGTRQGVVAAALTITYDYVKATNVKIPYSQSASPEPDTEGIINSTSMYFDCSSFTFWALYNGGFKFPSDLPYAQTDVIYDWAVRNNYIGDLKKGQPGDFLDTKGKGHIMVIVGNYDGGYYIAESNRGGAQVIKRSYEELDARDYALIDMTKYYEDKSNVRN